MPEGFFYVYEVNEISMKYAATSPPGFFTLVFLTGLSILSLNMFLPSLSNIAQEFQVDYTIVSLSVAERC